MMMNRGTSSTWFNYYYILMVSAMCCCSVVSLSTKSGENGGGDIETLHSSRIIRVSGDHVLRTKRNSLISSTNDNNSPAASAALQDINNIRTNRTCDNVVPFLMARNISLTSGSSSPGKICDGQCCTNEAEAVLRKQVQSDFAALLRYNSRSLYEMLSFTKALQNHVWDTAHKSQDKTMLLFYQVYNAMAVLTQEPIDRLYQSIRHYVLENNTKVINQPQSSGDISSYGGGGGPPLIDIKDAINQAFADIFPLVYYNILMQNTTLDVNRNSHPNATDFTNEYKTCLRKSVEIVQPFGDVPKDLGLSLEKSLETVRILLQALRIGVEVLNATDTLLIDHHQNGAGNSECYDGLLKMTYCPKCQGLVSKYTKPCSGYCLNVLRGCLTKYVAELDTPWTGYMEGVESMVAALRRGSSNSLNSYGGTDTSAGDNNNMNVDYDIKLLHSQISDALMYAIKKKVNIHSRVKSHCGPAHFIEDSSLLHSESNLPPGTSFLRTRSTSRNHHHFQQSARNNFEANTLLSDMRFTNFRTYIGKTKGFYGNLADTICQDKSFTEPNDQHCWNGERIAEYTKTVVDIGLDMQKYNPEVKLNTNSQDIEPKIAELVDKLRHVHHLALSSIGSTQPEIDYMQRDGVDGSGSGAGPDFDDSDDEYSRGSGSGNGQIVDEEHSRKNVYGPGIVTTMPDRHGPSSSQPKVNVIQDSSSAKALPNLLLLIVSSVLLIHGISLI